MWVSQYAKDKSVVDIGCGHGYGSDFLSNGIAKTVLGIDTDLKAIEYARAHYARPNLSFRVVDVCSNESIGEFDVAISFEVLEHLVNVDAYLTFVRRCLNERGSFFLSTPNRLFAERVYVGGKSPNPLHVKEYTPTECLELLQRYFEVEGIFMEYGTTGLDETTVKDFHQIRKVPIPGLVKRLLPVGVKEWYLNKFSVRGPHNKRGRYREFAIEQVTTVSQLDRTKSTQLFRARHKYL